MLKRKAEKKLRWEYVVQVGVIPSVWKGCNWVCVAYLPNVQHMREQQGLCLDGIKKLELACVDQQPVVSTAIPMLELFKNAELPPTVDQLSAQLESARAALARSQDTDTDYKSKIADYDKELKELNSAHRKEKKKLQTQQAQTQAELKRVGNKNNVLLSNENRLTSDILVMDGAHQQHARDVEILQEKLRLLHAETTKTTLSTEFAANESVMSTVRLQTTATLAANELAASQEKAAYQVAASEARAVYQVAAGEEKAAYQVAAGEEKAAYQVAAQERISQDAMTAQQAKVLVDNELKLSQVQLEASEALNKVKLSAAAAMLKLEEQAKSSAEYVKIERAHKLEMDALRDANEISQVQLFKSQIEREQFLHERSVKAAEAADIRNSKFGYFMIGSMQAAQNPHRSGYETQNYQSYIERQQEALTGPSASEQPLLQAHATPAIQTPSLLALTGTSASGQPLQGHATPTIQTQSLLVHNQTHNLLMHPPQPGLPYYGHQPPQPGPYYGHQPPQPGPYYGHQPPAPGPYYGHQPSAPGPYYGQQPPAPGPYYGHQPPPPGPYYGHQPPAPGPYYGQQPPAPGPYYGQQPPAPGPYYGHQPPPPGPYHGQQLPPPRLPYHGSLDEKPSEPSQPGPPLSHP